MLSERVAEMVAEPVEARAIKSKPWHFDKLSDQQFLRHCDPHLRGEAIYSNEDKPKRVGLSRFS